jgi:hypothetical protein
VLPTAVDETSTFQATLTFEHLGDKYFLDQIKTPAGIYTIATPQPMTAVVGGDVARLCVRGRVARRRKAARRLRCCSAGHHPAGTCWNALR